MQLTFVLTRRHFLLPSGLITCAHMSASAPRRENSDSLKSKAADAAWNSARHKMDAYDGQRSISHSTIWQIGETCFRGFQVEGLSRGLAEGESFGGKVFEDEDGGVRVRIHATEEELGHAQVEKFDTLRRGEIREPRKNVPRDRNNLCFCLEILRKSLTYR